jgi:hypothetical protein
MNDGGAQHNELSTVLDIALEGGPKEEFIFWMMAGPTNKILVGLG